MANATTMTYGSYNFSPVPFLTLRKDYDLAGDNTHIGATFKATLDGLVTPLPGVGGLDIVDGLQDALRSALATDGQRFLIKCGSTTVLESYPTILGLEYKPTNNNWVLTTDYTIDMEWHEDDLGEDSGLTPLVKAVDEEWQIESVDDNAYYNWSPNGMLDVSPFEFRVTHSLSATGKRVYDSGGLKGSQEAWENAQDWVVARLGWVPTDIDDVTEITGPTILGSHGVINLDSDDFNPYNHIRTKTINEDAGTFAVTESWLVINPSGSGIAGIATEEFTATVRGSIQSDILPVTVEGTIQGLESRDYGSTAGDFDITTTKYDNALVYWTNVQAKLYHRAVEVSNGIATRTINASPGTKVIAHSPPKGTISYTYEYDDRPCNFITGALTESILINDSNPTDVFASLTVLGRARGPILQSIDTVTAPTRNINIELTMPIPSGCDTGNVTAARTAAPTADVECLLKGFEDELTAAYDQVFKQADDSSWNPKTGRYSRQVTWMFVNCTGSAPSTAMSC